MVAVGGFVILNLGTGACGESQAGWIDQTGSSGFHVKTPAGWTAETSADAHVLIKNGDGSAFVYLLPFKCGSEVTATKLIQPLIAQLPKIFPRAEVSDIKQISTTPDLATAKILFGSKGGSRANVLSYTQNGAGMLYAISAPSDKFESVRATLVRVLSSFRYGESRQPNAPNSGGLEFTSWTEPAEQAFSVQVPKGWNVTGGITRASPIDVRTEVVATSPDGQIRAQSGEGKMLPFKPLTGTVFAKSFHPGSISEYHGWFMFLDYEPGAQFSSGYLRTILYKNYSNLQIGDSHDLPTVTQAIQSIFEKSPIQTNVSCGYTSFTYTDQGKPMSGLCFATTIFSAPGTMSQGWTAVPAICTAPPDKIGVGLQALLRLSVPKWNPEWVAKLNDRAFDYTKVIQATAQNDRAMSDRIYNNFIGDLHNSGRQMENILTGTTDVRDASGGAYHVASGHNYYYLGSGGLVVGSNSATPPDIGFTPLTQF